LSPCRRPLWYLKTKFTSRILQTTLTGNRRAQLGRRIFKPLGALGGVASLAESELEFCANPILDGALDLALIR